MKHITLLMLLAISAIASQSRADTTGSATCGSMKILDECRVTWSFPSRADSHFSVQQFDPLNANWRTVAARKAGSQGTLETPVESGFLYRVLACDDSNATINCTGSTVVWAPFVQPEHLAHLIPSRVALAESEAKYGTTVYATVSKNSGWLTQVIQYNVYLMTNAIARANSVDLPAMTPVKDMRSELPDDPIEQVQFNVYSVYSAARGEPID